MSEVPAVEIPEIPAERDVIDLNDATVRNDATLRSAISLKASVPPEYRRAWDSDEVAHARALLMQLPSANLSGHRVNRPVASPGAPHNRPKTG
jgi:hypothetical protein